MFSHDYDIQLHTELVKSFNIYRNRIHKAKSEGQDISFFKGQIELDSEAEVHLGNWLMSPVTTRAQFESFALTLQINRKSLELVIFNVLWATNSNHSSQLHSLYCRKPLTKPWF